MKYPIDRTWKKSNNDPKHSEKKNPILSCEKFARRSCPIRFIFSLLNSWNIETTTVPAAA